MNSWFKTYRSLFDNELWLLEPFTKAQAWIDMVGNANYEDGVIMVRGNMVSVKRGQLAWSERYMASRWRWSRDKVRGYMTFLSNRGQIIPQKSNIISLIEIINYDKYQTTDPTTEKPQTLPILKKDKNNKKDINININTQTAGNIFVNRIMESFKSRLGFNPTDPKPRFEAFNLVRRIKKLLKEIGREDTESQILKVIDKYFSWLDEQEWFSNVQNMSVIRRKFEIYQQYVINHLKPNVQKEN